MAKVLLIENEEILREIVLNILNSNGLKAIGTGDSRRGLQLAKELIPDLILCEARMPELDGYQFLGALRQDPSTSNIPFLLITAENSPNVMRQGQLLGASGYILKPFNTAQLLETIYLHLS
ncbi:MAG: response regulator [Coleofasciculaceae cyanobacterium]